MAVAVERGEEERRLRRWRGRGGRQEDGFIYLSRRSSLYFTAPPEADTKTNGLSSRSCKTSPPPPPPPPAPPACPPNGDSPSNANVKHRRGELDSFNAATSTVRCLARSSRNRKNQPSVYRAESVSGVCTYIQSHHACSVRSKFVQLRPIPPPPEIHDATTTRGDRRRGGRGIKKGEATRVRERGRG